MKKTTETTKRVAREEQKVAEGQIKKLYIVYILEILKKYSDFNHRLLQQDLINYMRKDYGMEIERKAIARNIGNLQDMGYEIEHEGGYYLAERTFEDSELRLLIDSVLASRHIPKKQARDLIEKLTAQSSIYFKKQMRHICNIENMDHDLNNELFLSIDVIGEAIEHKRQIRFYYNKYEVDKKLYHTTKEKHLVNPYQIVVANGRYYLIGNVDKYDNVTHFRVERITQAEVTQTAAKPAGKVTELAGGLDLPRHMVEHIYMFSGPSAWVYLRVKKALISDVIDWLGKDIEIAPDRPENEDTYLVRAKVNEDAICYWALQFGEGVELLGPRYLRSQLREIVRMMGERYER